MFHDKGPSFFELAEQALSSTTRGYDLLARKFEYTPFRTPDALLEPLAAAAGEEGPIAAALDIACGTGAVMRHLRPYCSERVVGIDLSSGMLEEAGRQLAGSPGDASVELVKGDIFDMPFEEEFDVAASCGAFGHILQHQQDTFARQLRKVLKPGGRFIFVTRPMPHLLSPARIISRTFNAAMHVRNALVDPPFIMFYLTFTLERARDVLERHGFDVEARDVFGGTRFAPYRLVVAKKK